MAAFGAKPLRLQFTEHESKESPTISFFPFTTPPSPRNHTPSIAERAKAFTASGGSIMVKDSSTKKSASSTARKESMVVDDTLLKGSVQMVSDLNESVGAMDLMDADTALCPANIVATRRRLFSPPCMKKYAPRVEQEPQSPTNSVSSDKENASKPTANSANEKKVKTFNTVQSVVLRPVMKSFSCSDDDASGENRQEELNEEKLVNKKAKTFSTVQSVVLRPVMKNCSCSDDDTAGENQQDELNEEKVAEQKCAPKSQQTGLVGERKMWLQQRVQKANSYTEPEAPSLNAPSPNAPSPNETEEESFNIVSTRTTWLQNQVSLNGTPFEDRLTIAPSKQRLSDPPPPLKSDSIFRSERWIPPRHSTGRMSPLETARDTQNKSDPLYENKTTPRHAGDSDEKRKSTPLSETRAPHNIIPSFARQNGTEYRLKTRPPPASKPPLEQKVPHKAPPSYVRENASEHKLKTRPLAESKIPNKVPSSKAPSLDIKLKTTPLSENKKLQGNSSERVACTKTQKMPLGENKAQHGALSTEKAPQTNPVKANKKKPSKLKKEMSFVESRAHWLTNQVRKNEFFEDVPSEEEEEEEIEQPKSAMQLRLEALERGMVIEQEETRGVAPKRSLAELP